MRIYLDHNATSPMRPEVRDAVVDALDTFGNPSSVHAEGRSARGLIANARQQVAELVGTSARNVVFNSGATEGANHVIGSGWSDVLYLACEHDCVRVPAISADGVEIFVRDDGRTDLAALAGALEALAIEADGADRRVLVCAQLANNETGVLQPVEEIVGLAQEHGALVLCDAVQACGKIPVDFDALGTDYMLVSSHKLAGPKGIGALVMKDGRPLNPLLAGGGQELKFRAGTENVPAIAGFGIAARLARTYVEEADSMSRLRDELERQLAQLATEIVVLGGNAPRLPNTSAVSLPGFSAETLVIGLDMAGIAVSSGSACSSGKVGQSHVLEAMGVDSDLVRSVLRISVGWNSSKNDIDALYRALNALIAKANPHPAAARQQSTAQR